MRDLSADSRTLRSQDLRALASRCRFGAAGSKSSQFRQPTKESLYARPSNAEFGNMNHLARGGRATSRNGCMKIVCSKELLIALATSKQTHACAHTHMHTHARARLRPPRPTCSRARSCSLLLLPSRRFLGGSSDAR
eukprot:6066470-Pleurochrysis_carterae.AAC.2